MVLCMLHFILYILLILAVNVGFAYVPPIVLPSGDLWPPISLVVGFVFVVRDFAQRKVGHHILWAMLIGCALSWYLATPALAFASAAAFAIGELADWAVFTFTKKPFSKRILYSSLIGVPLDSLVFLTLIDMATPISVLGMILSKLLGAFAVYFILKKREKSFVIHTSKQSI